MQPEALFSSGPTVFISHFGPNPLFLQEIKHGRLVHSVTNMYHFNCQTGYMALRTEDSMRLDNNNEDRVWAPWTDLHHDVLFIILIKLGLLDYLAFSGVCKLWRSFALSNRRTFLARKEPLMLELSKEFCTLIDIFDEGRRYKTMLPDISRSSCVGVSCGFLIMLRRNTRRFSLVNPITRHELHFPALPKKVPYYTNLFRPILVYSSLLSKFVIIVSLRLDNILLFSGSGDSKWIVLPKPGYDWNIIDLTFFEGRVYLLNSNGSIGEMRLYPLPSLQLLNVQGMPSSHSHSRELVTSSKQLFMVDHLSARTIVKHELDFTKMEWVMREDLGEETLFISNFKCSSVVNSTNWQGHGRTHCNSTYALTPGEANAWYFPGECYDRNLLKDS